MDRGLFTLPLSTEAPYLVLKRRINKNVKSVGTVPQIICRSASYYHRRALLRGRCHHGLGNLADAVGVHHLQPRRIQAAFKTPPHEGLEQTVGKRIAALFMIF